MAKYYSEQELLNNMYTMSVTVLDRDELKNMQPADVAPVIHAHWELYRDENNCTYGNYACTNCHTIQGLMKYRYCPYCGAKMDER